MSQQVTLDANRPVVVTGDRNDERIPTQRCRSSGAEYYTDEGVAVPSCRTCGGTKAEPVSDSETDEQTNTA